MKIYKILIGLVLTLSCNLPVYAQVGTDADDWYNLHPHVCGKYTPLNVILGSRSLPPDMQSNNCYYYFMLVSRITDYDAPGYKTSSSSGFYKGDLIVPSRILRQGPIWGIYNLHNEDLLTSISLPDNFRFINGFYDCPQIKELIIPDSVELVSNVYRLDNLEYLQLPNNVNYAQYKGKFFNVSEFKKLRSIKLPHESLELYGCFSDCPELQEIDMANTIIRGICESSFSNLPKLEEVELPYHLIALNRNSLCNLPNLRKVVMPFDVIHYFWDSFNECPAIEEIWQRCETPYPLGENCFSDTDKEKCILYVPKGTLEAYRNKEGWKEFVNIEEYDLSGVKVATTEQAKMTARGGKGCVKITAGEGEKVNIYSLDGRCIRTLQVNGEITEPLTRGIYIVASDTARYKIVVE